MRSAALLGILSVFCLLIQMWALSTIAGALISATEIESTNLLIFVLFWALRIALLEIKQQLCVNASIDLRLFIRQQLLQKLLIAGPLRRNFGTDGELSTLVLEKVDALDGYISRYWPQQILVIAAPLLISIAVGYYSLLSALIMLLTAPLVIVFMILVGKEASNASAKQLDFLARMGGRFYDFILGLRTLRQFKAIELAYEQLDDSAERFKTSSFSVLRMAFLSTAVLELFSSLAIALVALYLGLGLIGELPWARGQIPVSYQPALFILLLAPEFYAPLRQLGADYHAKAMAVAAAADIYSLWHAPSKPVIAGQTAIDWTQNSRIDFDKVSVNSAAFKRLDLEHLSITAGEHWLITGASGSGKTTMLQLLCGFWPWQGHIAISGVSFADIDLALWRQKIGYLHQKPEFLPGTIASNLRLASPDASESELWRVLQAVGLADFVTKQQLQLQHPLIDNGSNLSGGQQQRLAMARFLLADYPILLMDEPWVHLDDENAAELIQLVRRLSSGRTLILVSHQTENLDWISNRFSLETKEPANKVAIENNIKAKSEASDV
ncbi:MAG: thiol reductant ABC exporter subunit CydD [Rheinheimera sp.]|nr:thiol reductant ABC exporter subunit CydD [Rheinheimera sp.]